MKMIARSVLAFALCSPCALCFNYSARAEGPVIAGDLGGASKSMASAALAFWGSLSDEQKKAAGFEFDGADKERTNWNFVPIKRNGLSFKTLDEKQRGLAKAMLLTGVSESGNAKVMTIMSLEQILRDMEKDKVPPGPERDPEKYFWSIFGTPGGDKPWGWRVEGHHVSLNFTIVGDKAVAGPAFMGTNPAEVREGPRKGLRLLGEEEDAGRAILKSLSDEQKKKALINETAPKEIVTGNQRKAVAEKFEGIGYADLTDSQKEAVTKLIALYANRLRPELAQDDIKRIGQAGLEKIYFAWAGGSELGQPHYYAIHGPTFLIEYDNTQNNANHVHTVWRDLENDFGGDLLKKHYEADHAQPGR